MRTFRQQIHISASPEKVWAILADIEAMPRWFVGVTRATFDNTSPVGVGTGRKVYTGGPVVLDEVISHFEPNKLFGYRVRGGAPVKAHQGLIAIAPAGAGGVEVTYTTELETSIPLPGDPVGWVVGHGLNAIIGRALAKLKALAERA